MSSPRPIGAEALGLAARLKARLRPMFAEPVILVDPSDPVIGGPQCIVAACQRLAVLEGKCPAHHRRWMDDGRPEIEAWAATVPASRRWLQQPRKCAITTCRRARREDGLCHSHAVRWDGQGRPDWKAGSEGAAVAHPFHRASIVTFQAVNLMPRAAPGFVGTTGIGGAVLAVRRLTRGC